MSFLDNLESNLKSMESREERGGQNSRDAQSRPCRLEIRRLKQATEWMERYRQFWGTSFDRLDAHLRLCGPGREK